MPLYDYECVSCKQVVEIYAKADEKPGIHSCPVCGNDMKRLLAWGGQNVFREEAPWIRSVLEVVAKDSHKPHTKAFLADPTRANYKKWMKAEGIRPYEEGEGRRRKKEQQEKERRFEKQMADKIARLRQGRIEL
jgi:putative FmdB family regulatory protein